MSDSAVDRRTHFWLLFSIVFAGFLYQLDACIVTISLPTLSRSFGASTSQVSWVVLSYLLMVSSTMLFFGKLADRVGLRRVFLSGYLLFVAGTLLCGLAPGLGVLLAARSVQGLGGAMLLTSAFAAIPRYIPERIAGWAFGILSTSSALGLTLGGPLGGLISSFFCWRYIFLIQVPFGIAAFLIGMRVFPGEGSGGKDSPAATRRGPFDLPGAILSVAGLYALVCGLSMGQESGWDSPRTVSCFLFSVLSLSTMVLWEKRCPDPLLPPGIFCSGDFTRPVISRFLASLASGGMLFLFPFFLEFPKHLPAGQSSLVLTIYSVGLMSLAPLAGRVSDARSPLLISVSAMVAASLVCLLFAFTLHLPGLLWVVLFLVMVASSYAFFYPTNNRLIMSAAPKDGQGVASGILATTWTLGMSLGVSVFETLFSHAILAGRGSAVAEGTLESVSPAALIDGFRACFLLGAFVCLLAAVVSLARRPISATRGFRRCSRRGGPAREGG